MEKVGGCVRWVRWVTSVRVRVRASVRVMVRVRFRVRTKRIATKIAGSPQETMWYICAWR